MADDAKDLVPATPAPKLTPAEQQREKRLARIARRREWLDDRDSRILAASRRAAEIADATQRKPDGMTDFEFRVARDARKPKRNAPMYLELAQSREVHRLKAEARQAAPTTRVAVVVLPAQRDYGDRPVVDVTADGVLIGGRGEKNEGG